MMPNKMSVMPGGCIIDSIEDAARRAAGKARSSGGQVLGASGAAVGYGRRAGGAARNAGNAAMSAGMQAGIVGGGLFSRRNLAIAGGAGALGIAAEIVHHRHVSSARRNQSYGMY